MTIHDKISELKKNYKCHVVVTVVKAAGSTPGKVGFKLVVDCDGNLTGTVGGGAIESEAIEFSKYLMENSGESVLKEYLLTNDEKIASENDSVVNMSCNGKIWFYYEVDGIMPAVYIFGGGHVGQALINYLLNLNFGITLIDNREEFAVKNRREGITVVHSDYVKFAAEFKPKKESYFVILTHGHVFDYDILKKLYERNLVTKYVGVIGSKSKTGGVIANLKKELGEDINLSLLSMPIGLPIGGNTADEIALSIAAQIQSVRYAKKVKV